MFLGLLMVFDIANRFEKLKRSPKRAFGISKKYARFFLRTKNLEFGAGHFKLMSQKEAFFGS